MLYATAQLGDVSDLLQAIPGEQGAVDYIKAQAKAGAEQAIPDIKAQIQPYVIAALIFSAGAFAFGLAAFRTVRGKKAA